MISKSSGDNKLKEQRPITTDRTTANLEKTSQSDALNLNSLG